MEQWQQTLEDDVFHKMYDISRNRLNDVPELPLRYVARLITSPFDVEAVFSGNALKPLGAALSSAMDENGHDDVEKLRKIGDAVLLRTSLWPESIDRRVSAAHFVGIGQTAYMTVSDKRHEPKGGRVPGTFFELASKFSTVADVITEFCGRDRIDLTDAMKRATAFGSTRAREMLKEQGVLIMDGARNSKVDHTPDTAAAAQRASGLILDWRNGGGTDPRLEQKIRDLGVVPFMPGKKGLSLN